MSVLVRGFFDAFYCGLTDRQDCISAETMQPKKIKEVMTEHYEKVSAVFNDTMFYPIACLNYKYTEIETMLKSLDMNATNMIELVKKACRTERFHNAMIEDYRFNILTMLEGNYPHTDTWFEKWKENVAGTEEEQTGNTAATDVNSGETESDTAIGMVVRSVMMAYAQGLRLSGTQSPTLRQTVLFRILLDTMTTLLHDTPIAQEKLDSSSNFEELVTTICITPHNVDIMTESMNRMHEELSKL